LMSSAVMATKPQPPKDPSFNVDTNTYSGAISGSKAGAVSGSSSQGGAGGAGGAGGSSSMTGNLDAAASASNAGVDNSTRTSNKTNMLALSLEFPQASDCFVGMQGGGGGNGGAGFLGFHLLNKDCWAAKMSNAHRSIKIRARYECGSKWARNALAYDSPRGERHAACEQMITDELEALMQQDIAAQEALLNSALYQEGISRCEGKLQECTSK